MSIERKKDIITATLKLAAENGLGNVSMNMIAEQVGIKKPSLYNHFSSKEEITEAMYHYLRDQSKAQNNLANIDYAEFLNGRTAKEVLQIVVENYCKLNSEPKMQIFYKVIYDERCRQPIAAQIMVEETQKMILASKQLFYAMQVHKLLFFHDPDLSAISFTMTIHGLMEYEMDSKLAGLEDKEVLIKNYIEWFCNENKVR